MAVGYHSLHRKGPCCYSGRDSSPSGIGCYHFSHWPLESFGLLQMGNFIFFPLTYATTFNAFGDELRIRHTPKKTHKNSERAFSEMVMCWGEKRKISPLSFNCVLTARGFY